MKELKKDLIRRVNDLIFLLKDKYIRKEDFSEEAVRIVEKILIENYHSSRFVSIYRVPISKHKYSISLIFWADNEEEYMTEDLNVFIQQFMHKSDLAKFVADLERVVMKK